MNKITHTNDSLELFYFLEKYPNQWHSVSKDKRTSKAVKRVMELYGNRIETSHYVGQASDQIKLNAQEVI